MHHTKSLSPKRLLLHRTLTPLVPLIPPAIVISAKQIYMVKGLMLHSGHVGITVTKLWHFNGTYQRWSSVFWSSKKYEVNLSSTWGRLSLLWPEYHTSHCIWPLTPSPYRLSQSSSPFIPPSPHRPPHPPPSSCLHAHKGGAGGRVFLFGQVWFLAWDQGAAPGRGL